MIFKNLRRILTAVGAFLLLGAGFAVAQEPAAGVMDVDAGKAEAAAADNPAKDAFLRLDVNVLEVLSKDTREYMMSYWEADSVVKVANEFNGLSHLDTVAPGYLKVRLTNVSTLEIKILPLKNGEKLAMTVYTIGGRSEAPDSELGFFSYPELQRLETKKYFKAPELKQYFEIPKGCTTNIKEIKEMIPFPTYVFSVSPKDDNLTGRLSIGDYINQDDYNILKIFLKPEVKYLWDGKAFKVEK